MGRRKIVLAVPADTDAGLHISMNFAALRAKGPGKRAAPKVSNRGEQSWDLAGCRVATTLRSQNETSAYNLDGPRHGGAGPRAIPNANHHAIPNANQRSRLDDDRDPKGRPSLERIQAERRWSAKRRQTGHDKRWSRRHAPTPALNLSSH
jgi:hypothetical protein